MERLKCSICKKKLNILCKEIYTCKCNLILCRDFHFYNHDCIYDYHDKEKDKLEKNLTIIKRDKV